MQMQAMVLEADVRESVFYDQTTGAPNPGYTLQLKVLDVESKEKYDCQVREGFPGLDELKELKRQKQPIEVLQQLAAQIKAQVVSLEMQQANLHVLRVKGSKGGFVTLICRLTA